MRLAVPASSLRDYAGSKSSIAPSRRAAHRMASGPSTGSACRHPLRGSWIAHAARGPRFVFALRAHHDAGSKSSIAPTSRDRYPGQWTFALVLLAGMPLVRNELAPTAAGPESVRPGVQFETDCVPLRFSSRQQRVRWRLRRRRPWPLSYSWRHSWCSALRPCPFPQHAPRPRPLRCWFGMDPLLS